MKHLIVSLLLFCISNTLLYAQDELSVDSIPAYETPEPEEEAEDVAHTLVGPEELNKTKEYKSEKLPLQKFESEKWKEITGTTDFNEKEEAAEEKKKQDKGDNEPEAQPTIPWAGIPLQIISYVVIIALVVFILYFLLKNISLDFNKIKQTVIQEDDLTAPVENIEELDTQSLLHKALASGNYRLAIRLYFLELLKNLHQKEKISWKKDKTNRDYLTELFSRDFYFDEIRTLTIAYEMVWYGEHTLQTEAFKKIISDFESLQQKLNSSAVL